MRFCTLDTAKCMRKPTNVDATIEAYMVVLSVCCDSERDDGGWVDQNRQFQRDSIIEQPPISRVHLMCPEFLCLYFEL